MNRRQFIATNTTGLRSKTIKKAPAKLLKPNFGGAEQNRTDDPHNAIVVLYQLSYDPTQMKNLYGAVVGGCQSQNPINLSSLLQVVVWCGETHLHRLVLLRKRREVPAPWARP